MTKSTSIQDLADKLKSILANPTLIARIVEQDKVHNNTSKTLDELDNAISDIEKMFQESVLTTEDLRAKGQTL